MSLKETQIGVAFTGSFCTYKKAFLELQKLSNCCGSVQTVFSTAAAHSQTPVSILSNHFIGVQKKLREINR